ncbi:Zn-ribbon domain-containing OB-fold protein [Nocardioides ginsengisoli]|uniref:Zn-ribbon domain-containing OB-fold protein n=1 Tax=Nocardioides ginsengisoli TaxID=363868 RepID=A0ABW3VVN1_9ACTN
MAADVLPVPERDVDSEPFWAALDEKRLLLQCCSACDRFRFPAMSRCPYCTGPRSEWRELSGRGTVYSWIVVRQAFWPQFAGEVPYALVTVDLAEGVRVVGRMDDIDALDFGRSVDVVYVEHPEWTEFRFAVSAPAENMG